MSKILTTDNLMDAAEVIATQRPELAGHIHQMMDGLIAAQAALAFAVATAEGVSHYETSFQLDFGGLCSSFKAGRTGQTSEILGLLDESGDW